MKLIWEHADTSLNPRWRGMTWAMIPSHMSGLCACTYHLFYNSPQLLWLVSLQASLTVIGESQLIRISHALDAEHIVRLYFIRQFGDGFSCLPNL